MWLTTRSGGLKVILERLATEGVPQTRADRGAARFFGQRHRDYASSASDGIALASRWLTQVIFSLSYNRQAALPWGASGWSHPMRRGSGAQPRSTGQGRGPCESRHGVVLQAMPGLAA